MSHMKKKTLDRVLAMILSIMMVIAMLPVSTLQAFAATTEHPDFFTVTVTDGTNPIVGATVTLQNNTSEWIIGLSETTDTQGVAAFDPQLIETALKDASLTEADINIEVIKDGYETATKVETIKTTVVADKPNVDVALSLKSVSIPETDYVITGFDGTFDGNPHSVTVVADGYMVKFSEDNNTYVDTSPSITDVGEKKVYVQISKEGYSTLTKEVTLKVSSAERTDFAFALPSPTDMDYTNGLIYENVATSALEPQTVTYNSSNENVATVDIDGKVSFLKAGTVTITATMAASTNYNESTGTYNITVNTIPRTEFGFTTTAPSDVVYGQDNNEFTNGVVNAENDGTVTYSIVSQERDGEAVTDVATIDSATSKLTILASGTVVVKAVVSSGDYYDANEATYTLNISKAAQTDFKFDEESPANIPYNDNYKNEAKGGESTGAISYEIVSGNNVVSLNDDGTIKAIGVGEATIKATKATDSKYEAATATYTITVIKADQTGFSFVSNPYNVDYGTRELTVGVSGGQSTGTVTYNITDGSNIVEIDETTGKVIFQSKKTGTVTIKALKAGDDNYNETSATTVIHISKVDSSSQYTLEGNKGENNWYIGNVNFVPANGYKISTSDEFDAEWEDELTLETEGVTDNVAFYLKNSINGAISAVINSGEIKIDKTDPSVPVVSYSTSFLDTVLETVSFGFYNAPATVTINVEDTVSSIDYLVYNIGNGDMTIANADMDKGVASFKIDPQYKGTVTVKAFDKAGRSTSVNEEKVIVVDNIAPGVTVSYDNNHAANTNYYRADRKVTIEIEEANFYGSDVVITVGKRLNNETDYTDTRITPEFKSAGGNKYVATYTFDENADYTFDITYTDKSCNTYDSYQKDEFTVDKIDPVISATGIENGKYYIEDQVLNLKVVEHNFDAKDVVFNISATNASGETVDIFAKGYGAYLQDNANWAQDGDTYTAQITLDMEGQYTVDMTYIDLAGRTQVTAIDIPFFCVDKTNPNADSMKITYSQSVIDVLLKVITIGFYQSPVTVTIEATDDIAGIKSFNYTYAVKDGVSGINQGRSSSMTASDIIYSGNKAVSTFQIPAQFRGYVSFTAVDKADRITTYDDTTNEIVADTIAPGVTVEFPTDDAKNSNYYDDSTTATITIIEANFFDSDVVITVGKRLNNEESYTYEKITPTFNPGTGEDTYIATIRFDKDADYTFDITYTDKSGNVYDGYNEYAFTVDKIAPVINVKYSNNDVLNETMFKANRTATIEIIEHNFDAKDVVVKGTAKNADGKVVLPQVIAALTNNSTWTKDKDRYTVEIPYTTDADYTFSIEYTDLAGTKNASVNYATDTKAPEEFTIDKVKPTTTVEIGNAEWNQSWTDFPEGNSDNRSFTLSDNDKVTVTVINADELSGIDYVECFRTDVILSLAEAKAQTWTKAKLNANGIFTFDVDPGVNDERFVIYVHIVDKAGNEHYVSSDGVIVDSTRPDVEKVSPVVTVTPAETSEDHIYNADVLVDVEVKDPISGTDIFSGLKSVTYKIYNKSIAEGETVTAKGTLFAFKNSAPQKDDLVQWLSTSKKNKFRTQLEQILVKSADNNSNQVVVEITAMDNAGNKTVKTCDIKIDITAPTIVIDYDYDVADSQSYFKSNRTATIVITERNFTPEDAKITIKNTDGVIPTVSSWTKKDGTGNLDDTTWTATIVYDADGDYEFAISYTDDANNICGGPTYTEGTVAGDMFTIDKTVPVVAVSYDNDDVLNGNYYKAIRTATIVITERNLEPNGVDKDRVVVTMSATDDSAAIANPSVSTWTTNGDKHTATITYSGDALYTFDMEIKDKASNDSADFVEQTFYVDNTAPTLKITGVANNSANNGDVIPVVSYSDANYDAKQVTITLTGANRKGVALDGAYTEIHNGRTFTFKNFAEKKEVDDIYTLTASLTDKAGNTTTETITFSVNRFGSTYALSEAAENLNGTYVQEPVDVVVTETNADELSNIKITLFKDGETMVLKEDADYEIEVQGGNRQWYHYTYTIFAKNFEEDGVYSLTFESDDSAGNEAKNNQDTKNTAINFGVDSTLPIINIENLESKTTYALDNLIVDMSVKDNLKLTKVIVELDGKEIKAWSDEELEAMVKNGGNVTFHIAGDSTHAHKLVVYAIDAAGNGEKTSETALPANVEIVDDFYVTTNLWVRYYTNKSLFFGSIASVIFLAGLIVFHVLYKKKKNEGKQ